MAKSKFRGHRCDPCISHHRPCDGIRPVCGACHFRIGRSNEKCHWSHDQPPPARIRRTAKGPRHDHPRPQESSSDNDDSTALNDDLSTDEEEEVTFAPLSDAESGSFAQLSLPSSSLSAQKNKRTLRPQAPEAPQSSSHYISSEAQPPSNPTTEDPTDRRPGYRTQQESTLHTNSQRGTMDPQPALNTNQGHRSPPSPLGRESSDSARQNAIDLTAGTGTRERDTRKAYARQSTPFRSTITPASVRSGDLPIDGIVIPNVDRGLNRYVHQTTSHLTVDPTDPRWHFRQPRVIVVSEGQGQLTWEYPYRPGRPTFPMTPDEAAPFLFSADGQPLLGNMPVADQEIFEQQPRGNDVHDQARPNNIAEVTVAADNIGQQQELLNNGGSGRTVAENAEDDGWMEDFVDLDGNAN